MLIEPAERGRFQVEPFSFFYGVGQMNEIGLRIMNTNAHVTAAKNLANLIADSFVDALDVELCGEGGLDAVDNRQFRIVLFCFLQQALRLVEEARVFESGAQGGGHCCQQANIRFAIGIFSRIIINHDIAKDAIAADDGHGYK